MDLPLFLHIQHHSTATIFRLRKFSCIKIFPKAAIHTKNDTLDEALTRLILFQENKEPSWLAKTL